MSEMTGLTPEPGPSSIYTSSLYLETHRRWRYSPNHVIFSKGRLASLQPLQPQIRLLTTCSVPVQILLHQLFIQLTFTGTDWMPGTQPADLRLSFVTLTYSSVPSVNSEYK